MKNKIINIVLLLFFVIAAAIIVVAIEFIDSPKRILGIENYDKNYYIKEYGGDLNSNLLIFPENKSNMINATFSSSFKTNLFDSEGYILLETKYTKENFDSEINRLKNIHMTIYSSCKENAESIINNIIYDDKSYNYPAYITIDGLANTYEYALINEESLEIIYIYLAYPKVQDISKKYLKKDLSVYSIKDTLNMYSVYNHSFDNGKSFTEFNDCY